MQSVSASVCHKHNNFKSFIRGISCRKPAIIVLRLLHNAWNDLFWFLSQVHDLIILCFWSYLGGRGENKKGTFLLQTLDMHRQKLLCFHSCSIDLKSVQLSLGAREKQMRTLAPLHQPKNGYIWRYSILSAHGSLSLSLAEKKIGIILIQYVCTIQYCIVLIYMHHKNTHFMVQSFIFISGKSMKLPWRDCMGFSHPTGLIN